MTTRHTNIQLIRQRFGRTDAIRPSSNELDAACNISEDATDLPLPSAIAKLLAQRAAVQKSAFNSTPRSGQILRVPPRSNDKSSSSPNEYLAVLIDSPQTSEKWSGWIVGRDPEYATEWDLILGPEDDPRDPMCQVIQVWNTVSLTLKESDQVLAELTSERHSAVRALAKDFSQHALPNPIQDTRMGVLIAREACDGTGIVTGTPISREDDSRSEYQAIYKEAALWISVGTPVLSPVSTKKLPEKSSLSLWLKRFLTGSDDHFSIWRAGSALATLVIVPLLVVLISKSPSEQIQVATQSITSESKPEFRYISSGAIQELRVTNPEAHAQLIEQRLTELGARPEVRSSEPGLISIFADIGKIPETKRLALLKDFGLGQPIDGILRVDIYQDAKNTAPAILGGK
jgi:hypothetical protein